MLHVFSYTPKWRYVPNGSASQSESSFVLGTRRSGKNEWAAFTETWGLTLLRLFSYSSSSCQDNFLFLSSKMYTFLKRKLVRRSIYSSMPPRCTSIFVAVCINQLLIRSTSKSVSVLSCASNRDSQVLKSSCSYLDPSRPFDYSAEARNVLFLCIDRFHRP